MPQVPTYSQEERMRMAPHDVHTPSHVLEEMSDEQFGYTYDKDLRAKDPHKAMRKSFNPFNPPNFADNAAEWLGEKGQKGIQGVSRLAQSGYLGAGAVGVGAGALGGYGLYRFLTRDKAEEDNKKKVSRRLGPKASAILGAAILGGTTLSAHSYRTKTASSSDLISQIQRSNINASEKQQLINGVRRLSNAEQDRLSRSTRGVVGAALGAAVGRYLRSKGLLPMLVGGMIGGAMGWGSFSTPRRPTTPFYTPKYGQ